jgi:hypothetical protein
MVSTPTGIVGFADDDKKTGADESRIILNISYLAGIYRRLENVGISDGFCA